MSHSPRFGGRSPVAVALLLGGLAPLVAGALGATEVKLFRADTQRAFLAGTLEGISVDPLGNLRLADRVDRVTAIEEPFVFAAARRGDGWVLGTGNSGRVLEVTRGGEVRELWKAPEPEIFAVHVDPDGTVFAASSPNGRVYRIAAGARGAATAEVWFEPAETYVWGLARAADGSLLVATGTQGKLFRVTGKGQGELLYDADDTHLRSLLVLANGDVILGTAGEGRILRRRADGSVQTLHDADPPEVVALVADPLGNVYAAVLASEASFIDLTAAAAVAKAADEKSAEDGETTVEVTAEPELGAGTRAAGAKGPRATLLRIPPAGVVENVWNFDEETVFSLAWHRDRLWIGTGLEGKLYSLAGDALVLEADVDERQLVAVLGDAQGLSFVSTNAAALFRSTAAARRTGTYTSQVLDAGHVARWGTFHWRGEVPEGAQARFQFRTGLSSEPDATWVAWTPPRPGTELTLGALPAGRYFQWRGVLEAPGGRSPRIHGIEVSYRQENLRPRIASFAAMEPGQILVPANFNPTNQVYEPVSPDREGMFTVLEGQRETDEGRYKTLWKKGFRTLRWKASDGNGDELEYGLWFRRENAGDDVEWLAVAEELEDDFYSFDSTALPDGAYRFRLVASDGQLNQEQGALAAEQVSEAVLVDHTAPEIGRVRREGDRLSVEVSDRLNPLRTAEVSVDAGEWQRVEIADGLLDGRQETLRIAAPADTRLVLLRLMDAAFNVVTVDLLRAGTAAGTAQDAP